MGVNERREKLARAGAWLRRSRSRRYPKAADFARALDIGTSLLSRYETGSSEVPDDRAEDIADVLGLDVIAVRRGREKWVPDDSGSVMDRAERQMDENEKLIAEILALPPRDQRAVRAVVDALKDAENPDGARDVGR